MELKEDMYVRTKWGYICKLININDFREPGMKYGVEANYLKDIMFIGDEDISKVSYNIIDLIEVGDYVNGKEVEDVINNTINLFEQPVLRIDDDYYLKAEEIKSIVTKEQFESMSYKAGD